MQAVNLDIQVICSDRLIRFVTQRVAGQNDKDNGSNAKGNNIDPAGIEYLHPSVSSTSWRISSVTSLDAALLEACTTMAIHTLVRVLLNTQVVSLSPAHRVFAGEGAQNHASQVPLLWRGSPAQITSREGIPSGAGRDLRSDWQSVHPGRGSYMRPARW